MIEIIPSPGPLNSFDEIQRKIELVESLVTWVQIDVLDNTLIANDTYNNFEAFKVFAGRIKLEAHLMVSYPTEYVEPLVQNGFDRVIAQVEGEGVRDFIHEARMHHVEVGVALDAVSPLELVEPYLDQIDCVQVMTVNAGFSGQSFIPQTLPKIRKIHEEYQGLPIGVDGGVDKKTAPLVIENGATRLVTTSYLFAKNKERIAEAIEELKSF